MLGAFLDIEGAFDNTTFDFLFTSSLRHRGVEEICFVWIDSMLRERGKETAIEEEELGAA